ncbi:MAG: hypothetical protein WDO19_15955 [Bacteroidota bacterium]
MNAVVRNIVAYTYKPLLVRYLSKTRVYKYDGIRLEIPPPGVSPRFLFQYKIITESYQGITIEG